MKSLLRHSSSLSTLLLVGVIVTVAVMVSVARLLLPLAPDYAQRIEADLSRELGQPVRFESLQAEWSGWGPELRLRGVQLFDATGQTQVLAIRELVVQLDVLESLLRWTLIAPSRLTILGTELRIQRLADGSLQIQGVSLPMSAPTGGEGAWGGLDKIAATLGATRVQLQDAVTGVDYDFRNVDLKLLLDRPRLQISGTLTPPPELGKRLQVRVDLQGDISRPDGWKARVYAKGEGMRMSGLPQVVRDHVRGLQEIRGDFEGWSSWRNGGLFRLRTRFDLQDLTWDAAAAPARGPDRLSGDVLLQRLDQGWRLDLHDLAAGPDATGGRRPPGSVSVVYQASADGQSVQASVRSVRLQDLLPALIDQAVLPEAVNSTLAGLHLEGGLTAASVAARLPAEGAPRWVASGEFEDLGFVDQGELPGLSGLDGEFSLDSRSGEVVLDSHGVGFSYARLFSEALWTDDFRGRFAWQNEQGRYVVTGSGLHTRNQDLSANGRMVLQLGGGSPAHIDLQLDYGQGNAAHLANYLPATLPKATHDWLMHAISGGRIESGSLILFGQPHDFPFRGAEGVFEARFRVTDGILDYNPKWPRLAGLAGEVVFRNEGLSATIDQGRVYGARLVKGEVRVDDLHRTRVDIEARAEGPLADLLRFVRQSPLAHGREALLDDARTTGRSGLDFSIRLPVSHALNAPLSVQGNLHLHDVGLTLKSAGVSFSNVQGDLEFTEHGIAADGIAADFRGEPVRIDASTSPEGTMYVDAAGALGAGVLLQGLPISDTIVSRLQGRSAWQARVSIPHEGGVQTSRLDMHSDLVGVAVDLPTPIGKTESTARELRIGLPLSVHGSGPLEIAYGDDVRAVLDLDKHAIKRAELRFDDGPATLPESGVRLAGHLAQFSLSDWQALADGTPGTAAVKRPREDASGVLAQIDALDLRIDELELFRHHLSGVRLDAHKNTEGWRALVDSPMVAGTVRVPADLESGQPLSLDLEHLQLSALDTQAQEGEAAATDPRKLPALRVLSKRLFWQGREFRDLRLESTRLRDGMQVHYLQLATPHLAMRGFGDWRVAAGGGQQTNLHFTLESADAGRALEELGLDLGLANGEGKFEGDLRWPAAPMDFGWEGVDGQAQLSLRNGRLREIEPGAGGRVLGFLNFSRLLSLSYFQQLSDRGFSFDKLHGSFIFRGADLYTTELKIEGPVALVEAKGRTGIVARDYDHHIVVTPQVAGSTLPIAGYFLGGPQVGIGLLALNQILGGRMNPKIEYHVTGPWDDPKIETVREPEPVQEP